MVGERGFEPPTPWSRTRFRGLLNSVETGMILSTFDGSAYGLWINRCWSLQVLGVSAAATISTTSWLGDVLSSGGGKAAPLAFRSAHAAGVVLCDRRAGRRTAYRSIEEWGLPVQTDAEGSER